MGETGRIKRGELDWRLGQRMVLRVVNAVPGLIISGVR
jgi:hypothetical protein